MSTISLIASVESDWGIGLNNGLCLTVPGDLRYFKGRTMGCNAVMGKKTLENIGHPLSGRTNIILTHDTSFVVSGEIVFHSFEEVLSYIKASEKDTFIIGGESIYRQFLFHCEFAYITKNEISVPHDTVFPENLDISVDWRLIDKIKNTKCGEFESNFCIYRREPFKFI